MAEKLPANIRTIRVLEVLMQDVVKGMNIQEISDKLAEKYHTINRDLLALKEHGYVREERGFYIVQPIFIGIALAYYSQMQTEQNKLLLLQQQSQNVAQNIIGNMYEYGND